MSEKSRKKDLKRKKKRQKGYIPKYLQWWSLGVGNTGYFVLLICLVSYKHFVLLICLAHLFVF